MKPSDPRGNDGCDGNRSSGDSGGERNAGEPDQRRREDLGEELNDRKWRERDLFIGVAVAMTAWKIRTGQHTQHVVP